VYSGWLRREGAIDPELKELAHVVTDVVNECEYCTENHLEVYDLPDERIRAIEQRRFEPFEKRERAVMEFTEQVATDPKRVAGTHIDALREVDFSDMEIVELLALVSAAISANVMMDALNVHPGDRDQF